MPPPPNPTPCPAQASALRGAAWLLVALWSLPAGLAATETAEWIRKGAGEWNDPANWSGGVVPRNTADADFRVVIAVPNPPEFVQVNLQDNMEIGELTLANDLAVTGPGFGPPTYQFHIRGPFHWLGGSLTGQGSEFHLHGDALFDGVTYKNLLNFSTLFIHKTARWTGGHLNWSVYSKVVIEPGATFQAETGGGVGASGNTSSAPIQNKGTMRMMAPGQTAKFYGPIENNGLLDLQGGKFLALDGYGGEGPILIAPDAALAFSRNAVNWQGPAIDNRGRIDLDRTVSHILSDTVFTGMVRLAGDLDGDGVATFRNVDWESGNMAGKGSTVVSPGGVMRVKGQSWRMFRDFVNHGEILVYPRSNFSGYPLNSWVNSGGGVVRIASTGYIGDPNINTGGFVNEGLILKEEDAGQAAIYSALSNSGQVSVTRGGLSLAGALTNSGALHTALGAALELFDAELTATSSLSGNGSVRISRGNIRGGISPEIDLAAGSCAIWGTGVYRVKSFRLQAYAGFPEHGGVEASDYLGLFGQVSQGMVRGLGYSELAFGQMELDSGARIELRGDSAWFGGILTANAVDATLLNGGDLLVVGDTELRLGPGGKFQNEGRWIAGEGVGAAKLLMQGGTTKLVTSGTDPEAFPAPGVFHISGFVEATADSLTALPGADLALGDFSAANVLVHLKGASLLASSSFDSSNSTFWMEGAEIQLPAQGWTGSATLKGDGSIRGSIPFQDLRLEASTNLNRIVVNGDLKVSNSFKIALAQGSGALFAPRVTVRGNVQLQGSMEVSSLFERLLATPSGAPIVLLESDNPISVAWPNIRSGEILSTPDKAHRFRLFFGDTSPFGNKSLVLAGFGTAFDLWRLERFNPAELANEGISGLLADSDANGFGNAAEFILNIPVSTKRGEAPALLVAPENTYVLVRVRRVKDGGGLGARLAVSDNLNTWEEILLGASSAKIQLHQTLDLGNAYEYTYLYPAKPAQLFVRTLVFGSP